MTPTHLMTKRELKKEIERIEAVIRTNQKQIKELSHEWSFSQIVEAIARINSMKNQARALLNRIELADRMKL